MSKPLIRVATSHEIKNFADPLTRKKVSDISQRLEAAGHRFRGELAHYLVHAVNDIGPGWGCRNYYSNVYVADDEKGEHILGTGFGGFYAAKRELERVSRLYRENHDAPYVALIHSNSVDKATNIFEDAGFRPQVLGEISLN